MMRGGPPLSPCFLALDTRGGHSPLSFPPTRHDERFPSWPVTTRRGRGQKMRVLEDVPHSFIFTLHISIQYIFSIKSRNKFNKLLNRKIYQRMN
jgi:hypothetical protein